MRAALALAVVLLAGCESASEPSVRATASPPRTSLSPSPSGQPSSSPSTSPSATPRTIQLLGSSLGVTRIGAAKQEAIKAVAEVLGTPRRPTSSFCIHALTEAHWPDLVLAFDDQERLSGWAAPTARLATPSGVRVGSTVATLKRVYGDRLTFYPKNPDNPPSYEVRGVDMRGYLSGTADSDRVIGLINGSCAGP
jgi:hypothetical protein